MSVAPHAHLVFHDGTPEAEYQDLLATSRALVTSSLDEGFGVPLIEAMAAGTPLVVSDIEIFHEVAGDAALYSRPKDADGFASALDQLDRASTWTSRSRASLEQATKFSWAVSAARLLDVLDKVGGTGGRGERL